ncbi:carbohydrate-binding family 9-like protein [Mucilaginibacter sp.]|uniref:carbohydrate-binding family 9-like protein n=1 Tax=Mucilaginibacter sp. TaxID=1882438 RepID=UPI0032660117
MKQFKSPTLPAHIADNGMKSIAFFLDGEEQQDLDSAPWHQAGHLPQASFSLAHNQQGIYLKYKVSEQHVLTRYKNINDPVYKDSCVEFFIAFGDDKNYYNFEFNSLGTALCGYGGSKTDRFDLPVDIAATINTLSTTIPQDAETGLYNWELTLFFPFSVFVHHNKLDLKEQACRVNFYKCGDDLPEPHFLSWVPIEHPYPEFHLPEQFGSVVFV